MWIDARSTCTYGLEGLNLLKLVNLPKASKRQKHSDDTQRG